MLTVEKTAMTDDSMQMHECEKCMETEQKPMTKEEQFIEAIDKKVMMLNFDLDNAKVASYDAKSDPSIHWTRKNELDAQVKVITGQINILERMKMQFKRIMNNETFV